MQNYTCTYNRGPPPLNSLQRNTSHCSTLLHRAAQCSKKNLCCISCNSALDIASQLTATHCIALQHTATRCNNKKGPPTRFEVLAIRRQKSASSVLRCFAVCCSVLQCDFRVCCIVWQWEICKCVAVCSSVL